MLEFLYYSLIHFHACFINFIQKIVYRKFLIWRFVSIRGTQKTRSLACGRYPTPANDEKSARQRGPSPYKRNEMVAFVFVIWKDEPYWLLEWKFFGHNPIYIFFFPQCSVLKTMKIHVLWNTLKKKYGLFLL